MKKLFYTIVFLLPIFISNAQTPYGNEWINYSQKYYKFKIYQDGIYRIDAATLANTGIPLNTINPENFQLFGRGEEIYIHVEGESDGVFNSGDYIEFYAQRNDGFLDSSLYINTPFLPNPYYSLFNDTAVYFLTWNSSASNKRMILENDINFASYTPDAYFFKEEIQYYSNTYYAGETDAVGGTDAQYTQAEGWFDNAITLNTSKTYSNFKTQNAYNSGPDALIKTAVVGASKNGLPGTDHHLRIEYKNSSGNWLLLTDTFFYGYQLNQFANAVAPSQLGGTTELKYSSVAGAGYSSNRTAVSYVYIKYPHTFDLEGSTSFKLFVPDNTSKSKSFLKISNFNAANATYLYDITNHKRIKVLKTGTDFNALVPNAGSEKLCYLIAENQIPTISSLQPVTASAFFTDFSANAPDSAYIIVTHKNLLTEATNYKTYRNSIAGGSHDVVLADVDELYDQFSLGIVKHPLAIRNFASFTLDNFPSPPLNLFLIGKSIHAGRGSEPPADYRKNVTNFANTLVPSLGNPSCDNLFTAGLNGTFLQPAIPTGRLSARTPNDVSLYLNKVKDYESNPAEEWMKSVLHFGGGTTAYEQSTYSGYLNNYKSIIEDTSFGGKVKTFLKTSSAPIQINQSDSLKQLIETGVSLMTFFGHASGTGFDQSIDNPSSYNNIRKYPFLLANSCFAGDIHTTGISSSEAFVLIPNKGMIGQLASVSQGIPYALDMYSSNFYRNMSQHLYGESVGKNIKEVVATIQNNAITDPFVKAVCLEMTLHGDPAIVINSHKKPDYSITNSDVFFDMTSQVDSFTIYAIVTNIGKAMHDSLIVELIRKFPNGETIAYLKIIAAPLFKDTISFKIPIDFVNGIGLNKFKVTLDLYDKIDELSETNNSTVPDVNLLIQGADIMPVYPYKYAIIPNNTVTLKASTSNAFASSGNYIFQIDTTDAFIAPLASAKINSSGGVVQWATPLILKDSVVYYWRVGIDSVDATGYHWKESSFQYITGKRGWGQAHFFQFKNDTYQYVKYNKPQRKFDFFNDVKSLSVNDGIYAGKEYWYKINNSTQYLMSCTWNGFLFAFIDPITAKPVQSMLQGTTGKGQYGNVHCVPRNLNGFEFNSNDAASRLKIKSFIDSIPDGYYVLAYSLGNTSINMDTTLYQSFEKLGSTKIRTLQDNRAYILWGKKGATIGTANEVIGDSLKAIIHYEDTFSTKWNEGFVASEIIGPALSWGSLHWRTHSLETNSSDSVMLRVVGIKSDRTEITLANFPRDSADVYDLASYANASTYPYLKLVAYMKDDSKRTPPQIDRWQVIYSPLPELAVNPLLGYSFYKDTLQEGNDIKLTLAVQNISEFDFKDSLLITYWIQDNNRKTNDLPYTLRKPPFEGGAFFIDTIITNTLGYAGLNSLWVEVNPIDRPHSQLEQYHFNNIARVEFFVGKDNVNPLMDVTFDGVHILNGDIVSAKPTVLVQLKDENQFLALNDTGDFAVFLKKPLVTVAERIYFGEEMSFIPAVLPNNSCKINYTPVLPHDGIYQLIIQAKDRSNNLSGSIDYKINFEIVNKSTITEVFNYPNPFSTATKFVFTLTGSELPTYFKIQILTITGKVIREITGDELGYIHIGRNITEYAWDGKDEFGDQLANGIYLYKVITQLNGSSIEKKETLADKYFTKGFGKMYLIR